MAEPANAGVNVVRERLSRWGGSHFGNIEHHLIVAIIDHIPNGWVMFNGDI